TVTVNQPPVVSFLPNPVSGCEPLTVYFTDGSFAPAGSAFNWNFGDNSSSNLQNPVHTYSTSGNFTVTLTITNPQNCSAFLSAPAVKVFPSAIANFDLSPRVAALGYGKIFFSDLSINPTSWNWDFGDGAGHSMLQNPFYVYQDTGTYKVRLAILSSHNCPDTAYETVIVKADEFSVYIPNAFTPDDNGRNETFNAVVLNGSKYQMAIFDRWGSQIYQTDKFDLPWNGHVYGSREMCPIGVYIYLITVWDFGNRPHEFAGHVTLLK
ncbi:MAG: gliding motility-associated C-terminal domain-containing protein, partial [Bacteroidia bacterium]|nr:gliding motility-associated C-terminal domain-containing protein [Bacteroidia bacterium]